MQATFAKAIYVKTRESVEERVGTSLKGIQQKYEKQMEKLERERRDGTYTYNIRLYDRRKAAIQQGLHKETSEVRGQADRYLHTLGLAKPAPNTSRLTPKTTLTHIGARVWTKSAAGARLQPLFAGQKSPTSRDPDSPWNPFLGYIGPLSERIATRSWVESQPAAPVQDVEKGQCFKLDPSSTTSSTIKEAMIYLKLREDGCSKAKSMVYSVRKRCMMDSTVRKDGPSCHRTITVEGNRTEGRNWKGWQLHPPQLELGERFQPMESLADMREYEVMTREYERLQAKQERVKEGMDFEDNDKRRSNYFGRLNREWEIRQSQRLAKAEKAVIPPSSHPSASSPALPTISIEVPETLPTVTTLYTEPIPSPTDIEITPPEKVLFSSTEDTEEDLSTKPTARDLSISLWVDPSVVETFPSGSLTIRAIPPVRQSLPAPAITRKLIKRSRTRIETSDSPNSPSSHQDYLTRHKTINEKVEPETSQRPKFPRTLTRFATTAQAAAPIREIKEQSFSQEVD